MANATARHGGTIERLEDRRLLAAVNVAVDGAKTYQTIEAIGGAMAALAPRAEYANPAYFDQIAGDLGLSAVRASVNDAFEAVNDNADPNVFDWTKFDDDAIAPAMQFFQQMKARGVKTFMLTYWAPPAWMKSNAAYEHGGSLLPDARAELAENVAAVLIRAKQAWGIDITHVSIANEPWFVEQWGSTMYTPRQYAEALKVVDAKLNAHGLGSVKLIGAENAGSKGRELGYINGVLGDAKAKAALDVWATHYLTAENAPAVRDALKPYGKSLWISEAGNANANLQGALDLAAMLNTAFTTANATAWIQWQISDPSKPYESLMTGMTPNPKYFALRQFSRYVRPGAVRVNATSSNSAVRVTSFKDPKTGAISIVLSNNSTEPMDISLKLAGLGVLPAELAMIRTSATEQGAFVGTLSTKGTPLVTLPGKSIVTLYAGPSLTVSQPGTAMTALTTPNIKDAWNSDPLRQAAALGDLSTVTSLLAAGANPNAAFEVNGWTALMTAAAAPYGDPLGVINALLARGANPLLTDSSGRTALHIAAMNAMTRWGEVDQAVARVQRLVAAGINVNAVDKLGRTALHYAALLPKVDGDLTKTVYSTAIVDALLALGANPKVRDVYGKAPGDYAVEEGAAPLATKLGATGTIKVQVVNDPNHNGNADAGEKGKAGVTVWLDLDRDNVLDAYEPTRVTDSSGYASFTQRVAGVGYNVRTVVASGVDLTYHSAETTYVTANATTPVTARHAPKLSRGGTGAIRGYVVNDTNKDNIWTEGEFGIYGRTVWLDLNNDGKRNNNEPTLATGDNGKFTFFGLKLGTYYVREVVPTGWKQGRPTNSGALVVNVTSGATTSLNVYFTVNQA